MSIADIPWPEDAFPAGCAFMDGRFTPMADARLPVLDWGFLRSDATYDVAHVWKGRFFRLDAHLDRFLASVEKMRMTLPVDRKQVSHILAECVRRSGLEDAYVEMICTRGMSPTFDRDPRKARNRFIAFAIPFGWIANAEQRERGMRVHISDIPRIPAASVDPTVKNYHWIDIVQGMFQAYERDAETVLLSDGQGGVTEGPGFNLFVVKDGRVATPAAGVLEGITRRTAMDLCAELQIQAEARIVSAEETRGADELFLTSTAGGIIPATIVDGAAVGHGAVGPITRRLIERYWAKHTDPAWTTPVADL